MTTPTDDTDTGSDTCTDCDKPLGATRPQCFACGGRHDRAPDDRITNHQWRALLGAI